MPSWRWSWIAWRDRRIWDSLHFFMIKKYERHSLFLLRVFIYCKDCHKVWKKNLFINTFNTVFKSFVQYILVSLWSPARYKNTMPETSSHWSTCVFLAMSRSKPGAPYWHEWLCIKMGQLSEYLQMFCHHARK